MKWLKRSIVVLVVIVVAMSYSYRVWSVAIYDTNVDATAYENVGELQNGGQVEQSFFCRHNGLQAIEVVLSNLGNYCEKEYEWSLREKDTGIVVGEGEFSGLNVDNSQKNVFEFEKQDNSKGKGYIFVIKSKEDSAEHGVTVMKTKANVNQDETMIVNGKSDENVMVLVQKISYMNVETCITFIGICLYLFFFMKFLLKLFK